ncbi:hypothetical protein ACFLWF_01655 [Chloroflexota bacterium]
MMLLFFWLLTTKGTWNKLKTTSSRGIFIVNNNFSKNSKSNKNAAILFSISGFIFIILSVVSSKIGIFLPIGIALVVISIGFWQRSKKLTEDEHNDSSKK